MAADDLATGCQVISSHGIDLVLLDYPSSSAGRVRNDYSFLFLWGIDSVVVMSTNTEHNSLNLFFMIHQKWRYKWIFNIIINHFFLLYLQWHNPNSLWLSEATEICVNIGSGNGLLPDGTKPLLKPMLTNHQWGLEAFTWEQLYWKYSKYLSLIWVWKSLI